MCSRRPKSSRYLGPGLDSLSCMSFCGRLILHYTKNSGWVINKKEVNNIVNLMCLNIEGKPISADHLQGGSTGKKVKHCNL